MTTPTHTLLARLQSSGVAGLSGVLPPGAGGGARTSTVDFEDLLTRAAASQVRTGAGVNVSARTGLTFSDEQLERLSLAADRAESQGITTALLLIDGQALTLDVGSRTITGVVDPGSAQAVAGIDGVVTVPAADEGRPAALAIPTSWSLGLGNASLASLLERVAADLRSASNTPRDHAFPADAPVRTDAGSQR